MVTVQKSYVDQGSRTSGILYLVATPIGNLEDMTFRAIRTLKEVDVIAAEDTRQTRKLVTHFEIPTKLVSYHEHNKQSSGVELIRLLLEGRSIAIVSDAGLPAISDPGADLVAEAVAQGIAVVPIPGANAALSALIMSGLPTERFLFAGFPPRDNKTRLAWLEKLRKQEGTLMLYESPHRLRKTLQAMLEVLGNRRIAIIRELTKRYEEAVRGTIEECMIRIEEHQPLGEYCLIIEGAESYTELREQYIEEAGDWWAELTLDAHVAHYEAANLDRKEAIKKVAVERGLPKRDVYNAVNR
ncbi:16S rRNA (cytidine(1402)-2'-O)-methyltransferase [Paenibacillus sp. GCM10023252]|uniref:16S rRNA (cytidine(1402)-2'-O)-methyltransferase n=1 Tax=Paenibacillus sp. GCM10023252 TaxID=3252649 RepID=UPI00361D2190